MADGGTKWGRHVWGVAELYDAYILSRDSGGTCILSRAATQIALAVVAAQLTAGRHTAQPKKHRNVGVVAANDGLSFCLRPPTALPPAARAGAPPPPLQPDVPMNRKESVTPVIWPL